MIEELELPLQEVPIQPKELDPVVVTFDESTLERTLEELNRVPPLGSAPN